MTKSITFNIYENIFTTSKYGNNVNAESLSFYDLEHSRLSPYSAGECKSKLVCSLTIDLVKVRISVDPFGDLILITPDGDFLISNLNWENLPTGLTRVSPSSSSFDFENWAKKTDFWEQQR